MKYERGDLLDLAEQGKFDVVVHGCNCWHKFGAGIARTIRDRWPEAYDADLDTPKGLKSKLGKYSGAYIFRKGYAFFVVNAYTQYTYARMWATSLPGVTVIPPIDYDAVRSVFKALAKEYANKPVRFGIPKIGAGLAGGDWDIIEKIIDEEMAGKDVTCVLFE